MRPGVSTGARDGEVGLDGSAGSSASAGTSADSTAEVGAWDADEAVTRLFAAHYRPLVRLAVLLMHDRTAAEEVAQEAYVALHRRWDRLRDTDKALAYLRTSVVNGARSALRRRGVAERFLSRQTAAPPDAPSAEAGALGALAHRDVIAALRRLPVRQRETLVLRYYADLSEAEIADAMGISRGAVKSHASRGLAALRGWLGDSA